jgi:hypothetical protein
MRRVEDEGVKIQAREEVERDEKERRASVARCRWTT